MPSEQNINPNRYQVIPRTLLFITRAQGQEVLLLKIAPKKGKITPWTGRWNGVGGHIEQGEDVLTAARRELAEETGLQADLWLCGTLMVNTATHPGIALYIFTGEYRAGTLAPSPEGEPRWFTWQDLPQLPLVDDAPALLSHLRPLRRGDPPFSAFSFYDSQGSLQLRFAEPCQ